MVLGSKAGLEARRDDRTMNNLELYWQSSNGISVYESNRV